jgi:hypothetical protein
VEIERDIPDAPLETRDPGALGWRDSNRRRPLAVYEWNLMIEAMLQIRSRNEEWIHGS